MSKRRSTIQIIQKRNHPHIQPIRDLQVRNERERTQHFFVDGTRFIFRALVAGRHIDRVLVAERLLARKSTTMHALCWLAAHSVRSPGNLGTIMRTAEAVSAAGIIMLGDNVDPFHPATVRASMGSIFSLTLVRTNFKSFASWASDNECFVVGTSPGAQLDFRLVAYPRRTIVFLGDERKGLSDEELAACSAVVSIPMVGDVDSLNVSIATGVMLYELLSQAHPPSLVLRA